MIPTPKLKKLILEQFVRGLETRNTQDSQQLWTDISSELKNFLPANGKAVISPLYIKEVFYKEILPDLEHCNYGLNTHVIRKIENLVKIPSPEEEMKNLHAEEENEQTLQVYERRQQETAINNDKPVALSTDNLTECDEDDELPDSDYEEFIKVAKISSADSLQIQKRQPKTSRDNHSESSTTDFKEGSNTARSKMPSAAVLLKGNKSQDKIVYDKPDVSSTTYQMECDDDELPDSDYEEFIKVAKTTSADSLQIHKRRDKTSNGKHTESSTTGFEEGANTAPPKVPSAASDVKIVEEKGNEAEPAKKKPKIISLEEFLERYNMNKQ